MIQAETFVGSLAIVLAVVAGLAALGPFRHIGQLRLVQAIRDRFGKLAARIFVAVIASLLLTSGIMILRDLRPQFAVPLTGNSRSDQDSGSR